MSLESLCSIHEATIERKDYDRSPSMGGTVQYTAASRTTDGVPTATIGRMVINGSSRRFAYQEHEEQHDCAWYTTTDPQCNETDQLTFGGEVYFVQAQKNPDVLGRFYKLELKKFRHGIQ